MKKVVFLLSIVSSLLFFSCTTSSERENEENNAQENNTIQILEPVTWEYEIVAGEEGTYNLIFTATIDDGWYVYSQELAEDGPIPTTIFFEEISDSSAVIFSDTATETGEVVKEGYDELFDMNIKKFGKTATFTQAVSVSAPVTISGYLEYMTCDDKQCLFPDPVEFTFELMNE